MFEATQHSVLEVLTKLLLSPRIIFVKCNVDKKSDYHENSIGDSYFDRNISKICHRFLPLFLSQKAANKETIAKPMCAVNAAILTKRFDSGEKGVAIAIANHPADRFINTSDISVNHKLSTLPIPATVSISGS